MQEVSEENEWIPRIGKEAFECLAKTKNISIWFFAGLAFMLLCFVIGAAVSPMPIGMFGIISVLFLLTLFLFRLSLQFQFLEFKRRLGARRPYT